MNNRHPSKLNSFTDLNEIGRGGFGVVYSAKRENGEKVALKKIDGRVSKDRVWNEIKSMRSLKHRNIVEFYEDFIEAGDTYVVMELCEHGSLRSYVKTNGPLQEPIAAHVLRQLISAVTYMHRRGVLHRDLSAGNVFIKSIRRGFLTVKLGDFGLATNLRQGETACTIVGTPGYIAPQVFNQDYDQTADVFSLGGVLYTMLTARDPPSKGNVVLNGLNSNAANLIERMMHQDAKRRIGLTEITLSDFMRDIDEEGGTMSREYSTERRLLSRERNRSTERNALSREGRSAERCSRDRRGVLRSNSQPVYPRRNSVSERPNVAVHNRLPSTSNCQSNDKLWPMNMERCAGQKVRTAGGRYIVESDFRARFEVAAKGDVIHRILIVEIDTFQKQKVFVHKVADRREKCRSENDELIELTSSPNVYLS
ncbi:unnamed protein product [Caenorhabditis bovis]|uniref:Protein kinase domain-containing protein n=1 Tax=Caenorhabditis bovis TaxID=2654633 RepID=A0A8S1EUY1_9PELO|nr:unnamed protein product [Caenorhabditis bovis]